MGSGANRPSAFDKANARCASRTVATVGFPGIGLQGFAPKVLAHGHHGGNRWWEVELRPADDPRKGPTGPRRFSASFLTFGGHSAAVRVLVY
jgi:hypothetical protein